MPRAQVTAQDITVSSSPLTRESFAPFGHVVENTLKTIDPGSSAAAARLPRNASIANQGSALKLSNVTPMTNNYGLAPSQMPSRPAVSMFVCHPRTLRQASSKKLRFDVRILERHPFTTQTFVPMGLAGDDPSTLYLVIVAPTLPQTWSAPGSEGMPDLRNLKAFVATGTQAVTYGAGTWHAPMVVLGKRPIEFVVYQFTNGVGCDDCQEVDLLAESPQHQGTTVLLDLPSMLRAGGGSRSKL